MIIKKYNIAHQLGIQTLQLPRAAEILAGRQGSDNQVFVLVAEDPNESILNPYDVAIYPDNQDIGVKKLKGKYLDTVLWWGADGPMHLFEL